MSASAGSKVAHAEPRQQQAHDQQHDELLRPSASSTPSCSAAAKAHDAAFGAARDATGEMHDTSPPQLPAFAIAIGWTRARHASLWPPRRTALPRTPTRSPARASATCRWIECPGRRARGEPPERLGVCVGEKMAALVCSSRVLFLLSTARKRRPPRDMVCRFWATPPTVTNFGRRRDADAALV